MKIQSSSWKKSPAITQQVSLQQVFSQLWCHFSWVAVPSARAQPQLGCNKLLRLDGFWEGFWFIQDCPASLMGTGHVQGAETQSRFHPKRAFTSGVCTKPCGVPGFLSTSWWSKEQSFWRSLILQSCRLNYTLHLFNGEERAPHCLHQSSSNPQPSISLIFHSLPWALTGSTMIKWCFHVCCRHTKGRQLRIWVLLMWTPKPFRQLQKETQG